MTEVKVIDVHQSVFAINDVIAEQTREKLKKDHTFMVNLMASPGAGKTTFILRTLELLRGRYQTGVMEADIEATVDAEKMEQAGVKSIQIHTGGQCAMDAEMTMQAMKEFHTEDFDLLFLENVGNLVCPAETDTGASKNVMILSVPEGHDKPLKYPLMFEVCDVMIVSKMDTVSYFDFDLQKVIQYAQKRNPNIQVFPVSAKDSEGMDPWIDWLETNIKEWNQNNV